MTAINFCLVILLSAEWLYSNSEVVWNLSSNDCVDVDVCNSTCPSPTSPSECGANGELEEAKEMKSASREEKAD